MLLVNCWTWDPLPGGREARRPLTALPQRVLVHATLQHHKLGGRQGMLRPRRRRRSAARRVLWSAGSAPTLLACCVLPSQVMRAASGSVTGRATLNRTCRARNARTLRQVSLTGTCQVEGDVSRG